MTTIIRHNTPQSRSMAWQTSQDKTLSFEALGMLTYLLSHPDDWKVIIEDLVREGSKRDRCYRILKELINHRHIARYVIRVKGVVRGYGYKIFEVPYTDNQVVGLELVGGALTPFTAAPVTEEPFPAIPTLHHRDSTQEESNTQLDSEYESTSCITREGDDDVTLRDGESESVILKGEIRAGVTASKLPGYLKAYGAARMNAAYEIAASKPNVDNPIGYMVFLLTSNSPLTPTPPTPSPRAVAQSAYADWIDVGFGPGIFAPPEQPVTQGDTADDNTPALDDEQREYFRQVDAEDETTPDAEFTDMSDVIPVEIQALQK